jgi:hypothetical protein
LVADGAGAALLAACKQLRSRQRQRGQHMDFDVRGDVFGKQVNV